MRPIVITTTTGYIVTIVEPYLARCNDAKSLRHYLSTTDGGRLVNLLGPDGIILADRGYRDVSQYLHSIGLECIIPSFIERGSKTLDVLHANETRLLTKVRSGVERCIGRLKTFKYFKNTVAISALATVGMDLKIVAAIINHFRPPLVQNDSLATQWAASMLSRRHLQNELKQFFGFPKVV